MTNWIVGHTNRFRVAQTDRSIFNWYSWYGSSDAQGLTEYEFNGAPWESDSLYRPYFISHDVREQHGVRDAALRALGG